MRVKQAMPAEHSVALSTAEAVPLAHALTARIGRQNDIRVLSIKGPTLRTHDLRRRSVSADADVMVDPKHYERFCALLEAAGWIERAARQVPQVLPLHSRSFIHPWWPCDIDVHHYYPGFFGDRLVIFERLWRNRVEVPLANYPIWAPDRPSSAVISMLHAMRHPSSVSHQQELDEVVTAVAATFTEQEREALAELVRLGRAQDVLRPALDRLHLPLANSDLDARERRLWEYYCQTVDDGATGGWLLAVREASLLRKPGVFVAAVYPSAAELRKDLATKDLSMWGLAKFRLRRLALGIRALPGALRASQRLRQAAAKRSW